MRRSNWKNSVKKMMVVMMMACLLFTKSGVNSNEGIMPCGEMQREIERL